MHYPSDAIAGVMIGLTSLAVVRWALLRTIHRAEPDAVHTTDEHTTVVRTAA